MEYYKHGVTEIDCQKVKIRNYDYPGKEDLLINRTASQEVLTKHNKQ